MTPEQIVAIKCAYADLLGAYQAHEQLDYEVHDWKSHEVTIEELEQLFPFVKEKKC